MKRKVLLQLVVPLLSLCVLFFLLVTEPEATDSTQNLVQMSVIFREEDSVWATTRAGMEQAAADLGAELRFLSPAVPNDAREQKLLLERELESGAEGIILIPADRTVLDETVHRTGRVVVTLETAMEHTDGCVGVDNTALGEAIARSAMNGVYQGSTAALLNSAPGDNGVRERLSAARAMLEAGGRQVVEITPSGEASLSEQMEQLLEHAEPAAILAFEASAMEEAADLVRTIHAAGIQDVPLLYGMGSTPAIAAGLEQSHITAIHAQDDFSSGYIAVMTAIRTVRHQPVKTPEPLPFLLVRQENMYDIDRQKLLFPVIR